MDTFEIIRCFPFQLSLDKREVVVHYDKKRTFSIYYNPTIILPSNHLTI